MKNVLLNRRNLLIILIIFCFIFLMYALKNNKVVAYESFKSNSNTKLERYIDSVDKILLRLYGYHRKIDDEFKIDFAIQYILDNIEKYEDRIVRLDNEYVYEENDTEYIAEGLIDKSVITEIIDKFFNSKKLDLSNCKYLDVNTGFIALISKSGDGIQFLNKEIKEVNYKENNIIEVNVNYKISNNVSKKIIYTLQNKNNCYNIINIEVLNTNERKF